MSQPPETFQDLEIPRKDVAQPASTQYRVYSSDKEFVLIDAENAQTAIQASGIHNPLRVERWQALQSNIVNIPGAEPSIHKAKRPVIAHLPQGGVRLADAQAQPYQPKTAGAAAVSEDTALSTGEVEKLLNP